MHVHLRGKKENQTSSLPNCNEINHLVDLSLDFMEMEEVQREDLDICLREQVRDWPCKEI